MLHGMSVSTLEQVQSGYYTLFQMIYPVIHSHLASYLIFLLLLLGSLYQLWKSINNKKRSVGSRIVLGLALLFVLSYLLWFVVFHFYTFQEL